MSIVVSWSSDENHCAVGILGIAVAVAAVTFEIADDGASAGVDECLYGGVGVLGRVMDLRDVEHCGDARVQLRQAPEESVDVYVLRPVTVRTVAGCTPCTTDPDSMNLTRR